MSSHVRFLSIDAEGLTRADVGAVAEQIEMAIAPASKKRKRRPASDTSIAAAARSANRTEELRTLILSTLTELAADPVRCGATCDELHRATARTENEIHDVRRLMEIRRRVSDLHTKFKKIRDTGIRRLNETGNPMIVWAPVLDATFDAEATDATR